MRVPNVLQGAGAMGQLDRIRSDINRASEEVASGRRVRKFSDDPVAAARGDRSQARLSQLELYRKTTGRADDELLAVDSVLDQLERLMDVAASAGAAGRSGTAEPERFAALAVEVDGLRDEALRLANSRHEGKSLFAGRQTLTDAFTETAGVVSYQGDANAPTMRVGDSAVVETSIPGDGLFVTGSGGDVFQVLADLRDALAAEDPDAVAIEATSVEQIARRFSQFRARIGHSMEELQRHGEHLSSERVQEEASLGAQIDADLVDAIARLNTANTSLEAALGAGGRLLSISLMDVLG